MISEVQECRNILQSFSLLRILITSYSSDQQIRHRRNFLHTSKQFSHTSWVSYNGTLLCRHPRGASLGSCMVRVQYYHFSCQSKVQVLTYASDQINGYRLEVPMTPSLVLINLLEQPTELKRNILLRRSLVYYKRI